MSSQFPNGLHPRVLDSLAGARTRRRSTATRRRPSTSAERGEHLVVSTGTASGKTLAFNLPVLDALAAEPKLRALYLYPDEGARAGSGPCARRLQGAPPPAGDLRRRHGDRAALADPQVGERHPHEPGHAPRRSPAAPRPLGRRPPEPPLRRRGRGARLPRRLRLARRERPPALAPRRGDLRRRAAVPAGLGDDRQPRRARRVPPRSRGDGDRRRRRAARRADASPSGTRRSSTRSSSSARARSGEGASLLADLVERGLRTICFAKSRKAAELIHRFASERVGPELAARLSPYRAGYTPAQRRDIERRLVEGELLGVTATDALELGIDIGLLDCAISVGLPRHGGQPAAAVGTRRAASQGPRRPRRERGRPRPVLHARARRRSWAGSVEAAILDHCQPPRPRRPRPLGGLRGAPGRARHAPSSAARLSTRAEGPRRDRRAQEDEGRLRLVGTRLPCRALLAPLDEPGVLSR